MPTEIAKDLIRQSFMPFLTRQQSVASIGIWPSAVAGAWSSLQSIKCRGLIMGREHPFQNTHTVPIFHISFCIELAFLSRTLLSPS